MQKGDTITFKDRFSGRKISGTFQYEYNGNFIVKVTTKAARGGTWVGTDRVVRPQDIVEKA